MRSIVIALLLVTSLAILTDKATAQSQKFPYDAVIADDEVYSRSGPGNKPYYPTSRLRKGDHVTVIRHDHGGWFMIEPPPGSFAWVRQEFVNRQGDRGVITGDSQIVAWVGTSFGDDHYVEQRRLQPGESVEILGEKILRDEREKDQWREIAYFRIKSPKGHFRWIPGSKVVPADKQSNIANARAREGDPFGGEKASAELGSDPRVSRVDMASLKPEGDDTTAAELNSESPSKGIGRRPAPTPKELDEGIATRNPQTPAKKELGTPSSFVTLDSSGQQRLAAIDEQMKVMLQGNSRDWDFTAIEAELQALQAQESTSAGAARRLASLGKYKRIKADYDDFTSIMERTNRRDAELAAAAAQRGNSPGAPIPSAATGRLAVPAASSRPALDGAPTTGRFSGAGIIQRTGSNNPNVPKFVLQHPNGQRLAYLQGDGVDLNKYVGESMGLEGKRFYRQDLRSDFMIVTSLQPVKLKP